MFPINHDSIQRELVVKSVRRNDLSEDDVLINMINNERFYKRFFMNKECRAMYIPHLRGGQSFYNGKCDIEVSGGFPFDGDDKEKDNITDIEYSRRTNAHLKFDFDKFQMKCHFHNGVWNNDKTKNIKFSELPHSNQEIILDAIRKVIEEWQEEQNKIRLYSDLKRKLKLK